MPNVQSVAVAQVRPVIGDLAANTKAHLRVIEVAKSLGADVVFFPELSLVGYEPRLAATLALQSPIRIPCRPDQAEAASVWSHLIELEEACLAANLTAYVGLPVLEHTKPTIAALPLGEVHASNANVDRIAYGKHYLHQDEIAYFDAGCSPRSLEICGTRIGLAICYELSVEDHCQSVLTDTPCCYVACVAKHETAMRVAAARLSGIAESNKIPTLVANSLGLQDGMNCSGQSAAWSSSGERIAVLDNRRDGVISLNLATLEVSADYV
ncbi:MAG: carbon-nitrogen hydrolase family protein [Planctomycetota bacterium]